MPVQVNETTIDVTLSPAEFQDVGTLLRRSGDLMTSTANALRVLNRLAAQDALSAAIDAMDSAYRILDGDEG